MALSHIVIRLKEHEYHANLAVMYDDVLHLQVSAFLQYGVLYLEVSVVLQYAILYLQVSVFMQYDAENKFLVQQSDELSKVSLLELAPAETSKLENTSKILQPPLPPAPATNSDPTPSLL